MATVTQLMTVEEYVELEQETGERHEFHDGEVFEMVGGSGNHSLIISNLLVAFCDVARKLGHQSHVSDLRVHIPKTNSFVYPDVVVADHTPVYTKPKDSLANPLLIAEVLSPATEAQDRGEKFDNDCTIDSFREYLLVSQDKHNITQFVKRDGHWLRFVHSDPAGTIDIESLECRISLADIYAQVDFDQAPKRIRPSPP